MTTFKVHTPETTEDSRVLLESAQKNFGFIPNLAAVMAESPAMLEGYMTLAGIFDKSSLSETERQIILMTNNRLNGCKYCMAAHSTISLMKGVPQEVVTALRDNQPLADTKLEALRKFAETINTSRGNPDANDIQELLGAGYTQRTVLEVILGTGLKVLSNYTNHVAQTPLDQTFLKQEWCGSSCSVGS